jgi:hypothetical protein
MNKTEVMELLKEIMAACPTINCDGFYTREIRSAPKGDVELRLLGSLDRESKRSLNNVIAKHGLTLIEENNLQIIY